MTTQLNRVSNSAFPASITSQDVDNKESLSYLTSLCPPFVSTALRDAFFLPLYKKTVADCLQLDQNLAARRFELFTKLEMLCSPKLALVREFFSVRDIPIHIEGKTFRTFLVRIFESKKPVNNKMLRMVLFSFNVNTQAPAKAGPFRRWDPLTMTELSSGPLSVLRALKEAGIKVDSLVTASLGNVTFDGVRHFSCSKAASIIPPTIVINRGMTSVRKIADQLYPRPLNYLLFYLAKWSGWDANPEQRLFDFLKEDGTKREVVIIEALKDYYFPYGDKGGFDRNFHEKIIKMGSVVFRASFFPHPFQIRSHHSLSLKHLKNNSETNIVANTIPLSFPEGEKMSSTIGREIFHNGNDKYHTSFYVAGNDATLDTGGWRDVFHLLYAFIEEGQKLEKAKSSTELAS